jgi:radical SAM protein with 4Fe4S-binding SPASM domain
VELESDFLATCLEEGLLTTSSRAFPRPLTVGQAPRPSLRYLELQVTWRCNLACRHCYLGEARALDLPLSTIASLVREFDAMGGLRLLVSGGEPLLHPHWPEVNALLSSLSVRRVLLTNGTLLDDACLAELCFDEIQVSLDGLAAGHEVLRGPGTFGKAVNAAHRVREAGFDLSIATAAHPGNLGELEGLAELVEGLGAREWGIDVPCFAGRLAAEPGLALTPVQGAQAMVRAFGGAYHGSGEGMACGLHLCTVAADGRVAPCGFYLDTPLGRAEEGLRACWQRRRPLSLAKVEECAACPAAGECGGGCRFRAPAADRPDPVMCALFGV